VGDEAIPRPWSKYSEGSSGHLKRNPKVEEAPKTLKAREAKKLARAKYGKNMDDEQLKEFLEVSGARSKTKLWEDDAAAGLVSKLKGKVEVGAVANKKPGGEGLSVQRTKITFGSDSEDDGESDEEYEPIVAIPVKPEGKEVRDNGVSDMDYLKSKVGNFSDDEEDDIEAESEEEDEKGGRKKVSRDKIIPMAVDEADSEEDEDEDMGQGDGISGDEKDEDEAGLEDILSGAKAKEDKEKAKKPDHIEGDDDEEVGESGRLFVRNLPFTTTEEDLINTFKKQGPIAEVHIAIDRETKRSKGMAYVLYMVPEHAVKAMDVLDNSIFQGRLIHVLPARTKKSFKKDESATGFMSSYKASKEAKRKEDAASDHNWNTLFLKQDAVVDAMTEEYGVEKSEILDATASSMAVRVALGETRAIADTKAFLEENGVSVESFLADGAKLKARSKTVILVKNIPSTATEDELRSLFTRHGSVARVVMPPSKVMALVEFYEPSEARASFKALAYRPFKHVPLYLEWAPGASFKDKAEQAEKEEKKSKKSPKTSPKVAPVEANVNVKEDDLIKEADETEGPGDGTATIYVTNLNFESTAESLKTFFQKKLKKKGAEHGVRSTTIATRKNPKDGAVLSRGYGFIEFENKDYAHKALKELGAATTFDGHLLKMKLSTRAAAAAPGADKNRREGAGVPKLTKGKSATKIVVRNVPFEANKKEMTSLFHTFGQVKSVRMPKKFDGTHRGFAFVEFLTRDEAKAAVEALSATHMYGRHLVIEYAAEDQSLEAIQAKAKRDLTTDMKHEGGKKKKAKQVGGDAVDRMGED